MTRSASDEVTVLASGDGPLGDHSIPAERFGHLIVLSGTSVGRVFALEGDRTVLGRDDQASVQLMDPGVSRRHAEITRESDGKYVLHDLESRNGTYANSQRLSTPHPLDDGDRVQLGLVTIIKFTLNDTFEANYARRMYDAALRDGLTGAFNRRYFDQRLTSEFSFSKRHGYSLALIMLDLDRFKGVNDNLGHLAGDAVLRQLCERMDHSVRAEDVIVRYGGEEFAILSRDTSLKQASILAERIRHAIANEPFQLEDGTSVPITISAGVVAAPDPAFKQPADMVAAADTALYEAKRQGRNCVITRRPGH